VTLCFYSIQVYRDIAQNIARKTIIHAALYQAGFHSSQRSIRTREVFNTHLSSENGNLRFSLVILISSLYMTKGYLDSNSNSSFFNHLTMRRIIRPGSPVKGKRRFGGNTRPQSPLSKGKPGKKPGWSRQQAVQTSGLNFICECSDGDNDGSPVTRGDMWDQWTTFLRMTTCW
jgi:hypothetical protein